MRLCPKETVIRGKGEIVECDVLVIGGGMAGCGAAFEATHWGKGLRVVMVDKAATDRSGATAEGLSAINCYMPLQSPLYLQLTLRKDSP